VSSPGLLRSWKEISTYTGTTKRTLQRWERRFGFPVHRPSGKSRSAVVALPDEINRWMRTKPSLPSINDHDEVVSRFPSSGARTSTRNGDTDPGRLCATTMRLCLAATVLHATAEQLSEELKRTHESHLLARKRLLKLMSEQRELLPKLLSYCAE